MHDIWNPWHGCKKYSEGCLNCYMYYLDSQRQLDGSNIYKVKGNFDYALKKDRKGNFKIQSGEVIRVCLTSDFFLEEADVWREDIWNMISQRKDVVFSIITKRANRIKDNLPSDWGDGYDNVDLDVTAETQKRIDERIPILLNLPAKHKTIFVAPFIEEVTLIDYLKTHEIDKVICGGENYGGARPCNYDWVKKLQKECLDTNTTFVFMETGTCFIKDDKTYILKSKKLQAQMAFKSGMSFKGREIFYKLVDNFGCEIPKEQLYVPKYTSIYCDECPSRIFCNGCSNCGKCPQKS